MVPDSKKTSPSTEKDAWDRLEILGGISAKILIPVIVLVVGALFNSAIKDRDTGVRMTELAIRILQTDPGEKPTSETRQVRAWAVKVLDKYSGVPLGGAGQVLETKPLSIGTDSRMSNLVHIRTMARVGNRLEERSGLAIYYQPAFWSAVEGHSIMAPELSPARVRLPRGEYEFWCAQPGSKSTGEPKRVRITNATMENDDIIELELIAPTTAP